MSIRDDFLDVLNFRTPKGRRPMIEWAGWWDKTRDRWHTEGVPSHLDTQQLHRFFGLDPIYMVAIAPAVKRPKVHGAPIITTASEYRALKPQIFNPAVIEDAVKYALSLKTAHDRGEIVLRVWIDGFFWFPRNMLGIENHLMAFYDQPELMHEMNRDLADFTLAGLERMFQVIKPEFVGFGEDMSYNLGPMISEQTFNEFILPYYNQIIPRIHKNGIKVLVDSDGDITKMLPWFIRAGIDGVYPLERQAGVDVCQIRKDYPDFILLGAYDKMVMNKGKQAMYDEFKRLEPVIRSGGFIPSVDHQTPPAVSFDDYKCYMELFKEFSKV